MSGTIELDKSHTFSWTKIGIRKAAVFPDPVGAHANISRPYVTPVKIRQGITRLDQWEPSYLHEQWNGLHLDRGGVSVTNSSNVPSNVCWELIAERQMDGSKSE